MVILFVLKTKNLSYKSLPVGNNRREERHLLSICKEIMSQQQAMCMKTMKMQLHGMTEVVFPVKERKKQLYNSWNAENTKCWLETHHLGLTALTD